MVILDTCALIEACKEKPSLSQKTIHQIELGSYLLSISFAEIACKIRLGKLEMSVTPKELFSEFRKIEHIQIIDIGVQEWLESIDMSWDENKDPADRLIVSFATKHHCPIVTCDNLIKKYYKKVIW